MSGTKPAIEKPEPHGVGIARDLKQLKTHGTASLSELREFLARTQGRSPQEVLGLLAGSHLLRSIGAATVGVVVILVVGTVVPWWMSGSPADSKPAAKASPAAGQSAAGPAEVKEGEKAAAERAAPAAPPGSAPADVAPSPADAEKAIQVMGLGETKVADPKKNPLEKNLDNLLDKLE